MKKMVCLLVILIILTTNFFTITSVYKLYNMMENKSNLEKENASERKLDVDSTWLGKENPTVVLMGSSVTWGYGASSLEKSWTGLLKGYFLDTNPDINYINLAVSGFKTTDVLNISVPIAANLTPDVIIVENCLINDFSNMYTTSQSSQNIDNIISKLKNDHPNSKIYIMPPNIIVDKNFKNSEGLIYYEYVTQVGDYLKTKGYNYIDFWNEYESLLDSQGLSLEQSLNQDQIHPNDIGYEIWFNSIKKYFTLNS